MYVHILLIFLCLLCLFQGISKCRDDELEHKDIGLEHDAELVRVISAAVLVVASHDVTLCHCLPLSSRLLHMKPCPK